jgi:hypothetical protein
MILIPGRDLKQKPVVLDLGKLIRLYPVNIFPAFQIP